MADDTRAQDGLITLEGDDGHSYSCQILDIFEFEEKEYALLLNLGGDSQDESSDKGKDESSIVIMRLTQKDDQSIFQTIESEEEFDKVVAHVEEMVQQTQEGEEQEAASESQ